MFIHQLITALQSHNVQFAIVGGYAVALHGAVRGTVDIDIVITLSESAFIKTESALRSLGLHCRLPVTAQEIFQFRKEYIEKRNLIAWTFSNPKNPTEMVDIILTHELHKKEIEFKNVGKFRIPVLKIPALIQMKSQSGRPQDIEDIKALEKLV